MFKVTYTVDGVALDDPAGRWWLSALSRRRGLPGVRATRVMTPGRSGSYFISNDPFEDGRFTLGLTVSDKDAAGVPGGQAQAEKNLNHLTALLVNPARLLRVENRVSPTERYVAEARVSMAADPEPLRGVLDLYRLVLVFEVPGVTWSDGAGLRVSQGPAPLATGSLALPAFDGGALPIDDAVVRFQGPFNGKAAVVDRASGTGLSWQGTLTAGAYLFLNARTLKAHTSSSATAWESGTDVSGGLDYPPDGPLLLTPTADAVGVFYSLDYSLPAANSATSALAVRAERKY